ncbi:MAG: NAD-dependent DNA ligase LigA [Eubacteriales bacterium]|nr:NAD-dependent DNA ligase LigA [Eubacteriales bacterium]
MENSIREHIPEDKKIRIEELVRIMNEASDAYYNDKDERMSNYEWDAMFDELTALEEETGYVMEESPTQRTGAEEQSGDGNREAHEYPALSLKKSKDVTELQAWAGERPIWLSWKLDGITLVATYDDGRLTRLLTRGNGTLGTNVTYLAPYITGLPNRISYQGHLVVRGEAVISYDDFTRLNDTMEESEETYANPRNLVAGTLALDAKRAAKVKDRCVSFHAFTLVHIDDNIVSWGERMEYLRELKFKVVEREQTDAAGLPEVIEKWTQKVRSGKMQLPVDGLVIAFDDTEYAATGSVTGHHATNAGMAFKWQDTAAETTLDHIEWSCAASTISPVAVFDMVRLEGTEVRRASLCNLSEMRRLGIGADRETTLTVIKSNMIIPKCIAADAHGTSFTIPGFCPVCGAPTETRISDRTGTETLHCTNDDCVAKHLQKYTRFVSKSGMDIDGLSEKSIKKFINEGFITDFADLYDIAEHREQIVSMEGFGEKSFANMITSIEARRVVEPVNFIYALCIPMIGLDAAKKMIAVCGTEGFFRRLREQTGFEDIDGIGPEKSNSILEWYSTEKNQRLVEKLLAKVEVRKLEPAVKTGGKCEGLTFVITGDVHHYKNRKEFTAYVEAEGGSVTGSVSKKTNYLVNNDNTSQSKKNVTAQKNNIPIITEDEFVKMFG